MTTALQTLTNKLAERFEMGSSENLPQTLMATAFRGQNVSPDQMTALLVVANQHGLNPWTNEIYAFPNNGGIVPIVGVDGWSRIMNDHPQFDGIEFTFNDDNSCTCNIYRKDRTRPTTVTEYMIECSRNTQPWKSHPKRMLRHKAMIQCARLAFGFTGIYDQDEAERIVENQKEPLNVTPKPNVIEGQAVELATSEQIDTLNQLIQLTNTDTEKAFAYYSVQSIEQLSKAKAEHFIKTLNGRLDESAQNDNNKASEEVPL
ncbi:phage recombination protein Bet [Avibacterium paragallinarum]|uniref:phage recombination protein Bet n=1 Tax=Avibacterium paragallinarum TaxID=728 RepID=UPI00021ACF84|nr:phage recombination protein Bet [Avibacterium paragallinarum]AZI14536.1 phage recombination protein Bet [Avibacterium paragallinarum]QIR11131.1 phage recombination protein Bet [Avibacterium paragallinarum]QIR12128.1 phage recombination protein Bet [Avibacterium paragallinarum]QJE09050.1 phage recombination protein Bet [Avibacterium paragallinarum]QJE10049.1 phage recombination protein Bet [Avibacterium paragallinarum]